MKKLYVLFLVLCVNSGLAGMEDKNYDHAKRAMVTAGELLFMAVGTKCVAKTFYTPVPSTMTRQEALEASLNGSVLVGREINPWRGSYQANKEKEGIYGLAKEIWRCALRQRNRLRTSCLRYVDPKALGSSGMDLK